MDLYSRTIHQRGSWTGSEYQSVSQRILHIVNSSEEIGDTVPVWTSASKHRYQYVRATRFSESKYWREYRHWCTVAQEEHNVMNSLSTSTATEDNLPLQPTAVAPVRQEESLTFVGNFTHPPGITQDEMIALLNSVKAQAPISENAGSHGVTSTQKTLLNPTMPRSSFSGNVKDTHPSTIVNVQIPAQELQSATASHQMDPDDLTHVGTIYSSTPPSTDSVESLNNVMGHITQSDNTAALLNEIGPLTFLGNFDLPPHQPNMKLKPAHVSGDVTQREVISLGITPTPPTLSAAPVIPSAEACGNVPASSFSSPTHYTTREAYVEMLEYHRHMASYYKQLRLKAENTSQVEGSVLRRKRVGVLGGSGGEPPQKRCWEGIHLPDDAIEELCAIPGVWDLAIELGILTVCQAEELKGF
ncbi:uncharacterized protein LOC121688413 [Alosa sapidissima]|uniref:uncharacterized protein LOC121688413 n=1 Tax=Alosa sapidissima TaxID=34773 RepID=UPI001C0A6523|nr:uncharacterized protein LOC121688413 [Alosa sapidissima]